MLHYVIALFLLNMYSQSLGAPAANLAQLSISDALTILSKNCGNPLISKQIESMIQNCSQDAVDKKNLFECLMFYDINAQLCYAINNTKLVIPEDMSAQVNQNQDVTNLCNTAKDWTFTQKYNLSKIFQDPAICIKLCGVSDMFSTDSIFSCKYFNWGWEKLKSLKPQLQNSLSVSTENNETQINIDDKKKGTPRNKENTENNLNELANVPKSLLTNPGSSRTSTISPFSQSSPNVIANTSPNSVNEQKKAKTEKNPSTEKHTFSSVIPNTDNEDHPKMNDIGGENTDGDGDEGDGNDLDDSEIDDSVSLQTKKIISEESFLQKGSYMDEAPEEDHFFPFFLTSIILVVLLYILYHNKGKVTKVFLGLIVEGRQNGRRRNSRGHAYRRLDTLEQAMSGNLAAQPSKIIY